MYRYVGGRDDNREVIFTQNHPKYIASHCSFLRCVPFYPSAIYTLFIVFYLEEIRGTFFKSCNIPIKR